MHQELLNQSVMNGKNGQENFIFNNPNMHAALDLTRPQTTAAASAFWPPDPGLVRSPNQ